MIPESIINSLILTYLGKKPEITTFELLPKGSKHLNYLFCPSYRHFYVHYALR